MKRVSFWKVPDGDGNSSFWLHHPQHFPNAINRRWKEHDTEPAHYRVKVVGGQRQTIGKGNFKPSIPQLAAVRCTSCGRYHLRHGIKANDAAIRSHDFGNAQCRLTRTCGHVENRIDRKSTRLNSSHLVISYAVFCLKKKKE